MGLEFAIKRSSRHCAVSGRPLKPGESCYTVLVPRDGHLERMEYAPESWKTPPEDAVAWWRSTLPSGSSSAKKLAPNDMLLKLFDEWADDPQRSDMRYVLALLLVRRRVFRLDHPTALTHDPHPQASSQSNMLEVYCPRRDESYQLSQTPPTGERLQEVQDELSRLLLA